MQLLEARAGSSKWLREENIGPGPPPVVGAGLHAASMGPLTAPSLPGLGDKVGHPRPRPVWIGRPGMCGLATRREEPISERSRARQRRGVPCKDTPQLLEAVLTEICLRDATSRGPRFP